MNEMTLEEKVTLCVSLDAATFNNTWMKLRKMLPDVNKTYGRAFSKYGVTLQEYENFSQLLKNYEEIESRIVYDRSGAVKTHADMCTYLNETIRCVDEMAVKHIFNLYGAPSASVKIELPDLGDRA